MNPRKMRNRQIYYATMQNASKQLSCALSKDLRKKYGKRSVRIVEGDTGSIIRGEFSGVDGKLTKISILKILTMKIKQFLNFCLKEKR